MLLRFFAGRTQGESVVMSVLNGVFVNFDFEFFYCYVTILLI